MEDRIKLLPERVANQIAAGEVVNRSSSVVKELMENSIDAGASEVTVNVRRGGLDLILVVDDGVGMSPNDARMAFERHATSKIASADDIYALQTFGFRGEALASIAAVSQLELRTATREANIGTATTINGGVFADQQPIACDVGTAIYVRNIFYNLPARRAFAEREGRKYTATREEFKRVALCNPHVAFELYADDAIIYRLAPATLANRIVDIMGRNMKRNLLEIGAETSIVKISGYIGVPESAKKSSADQYMFVNGRFFRSPYLAKAIIKAYDKIIAPNAFPTCFIYMEVASDKIDVNVHPQKTEVKFLDEAAIWQILHAATRETLARTGVVAMMEFDQSSNIEIPVMKRGVSYAEPRAMMNSEYNPFELDMESVDSSRFDESSEVEYEEYEATTPLVAERVKSEIEYDEVEVEYEEFEHEASPRDLLSEVEPREREIEEVTITNGRYGWCRIAANMAVVDLVRAKERLLYESYIACGRGGGVVSQQILFPIELKLTASEYELMYENRDDFAKLGFEIEYVANETIMVKGLPAEVDTESVDTLIYELIQVVVTPQRLDSQMREDMARVMARNRARNTMRNITPQHAKEIVNQIIKSKQTALTPSGRRIMWSVTREDIKEKLG